MNVRIPIAVLLLGLAPGLLPGCPYMGGPAVTGDATPPSGDVHGLGDAGATDVARPDLPPPPPLPDTDLTVTMATWNVRQFFDTVCDSGSCASWDFESQPTTSEFNARAAQIAGTIQGFGADIVTLEEVESQACLDALVSRLGGAYPIAILGEIGLAGSLDTALLAKGTLIDVKTHRNVWIAKPSGGTTQFTRELLEVHLDRDGWRVIAFAAHFRSKVSDDPERRLAEAQAAQKIIAQAAATWPEALVVLGGDLNDVPSSPPLEALALDGVLSRIAAELGAGNDWTYSYNGQHLAIDHLLLATSARGVYVPGTVKVIRSGSTGGIGGSDHAALKADFRLVAPAP